MKRLLSASTLAVVSVLVVIGSGAVLSVRALAQQGSGPQGIADSALDEIVAISVIKQGFTDAQKKIDSNLVFAVKAAGGELTGSSVANIASVVEATSQNRVSVDIYGNVSASLLDAIASSNGEVSYQSARWGIIRASLPLTALESVAANADVSSIQTAAQFRTNAGALTSQGYVTHTANQVASMGITGAGVTVGVLSDSASPARVAALIASGDLPANTQVLAGQASAGADEGTAMMEIVHDIAPGAKLIFATVNGGVANFANNILALQAAGAKVIVDDVTYFNEGAFQDGPIARAVSQVTANGVLYFSSSANSGNLSLGTSGTWEGDFVPNGAVGTPISSFEPGTIHNFGAAGAPQNFDVLTVPSDFLSLKWSDPLGGSANDYDIFVLNSTGTTVKGFSVAAQTGTQDPYELIGPGVNCGTASAQGYCSSPGDRIVVVLYSGARRALRVDTNGGQLSIRTAGSTFGHNAGASTVSVAATYWNSARTGTRPFTGAANPTEIFSSDGPRKIFFNPNGTPIVPGNLLFSTNGGITLQKPDLAAADGTSAKTPGFLPFFGTSAAAPHAAGIAALIFSLQPGWTPAQVLTAMRSTAVDSMSPGIDRDSGYGIAMAWPAIQYAMTH
jgi:hypothetical protein